MPDERRYWFPAKRYGWGWGMPRTWQGWLVLAVFLVLMVVGMPIMKQHGLALPYVVVLTGLLLLVCWMKGEPPRWRSGD